MSTKLGRLLGALAFAAALSTSAQQAGPGHALRITKIDPPNWYATLPSPMLLVNGEGFSCATFAISDPTIHIIRTSISENGHWAQLSLDASPAQPETVELTAACGTAHIATPYTFAARRAASTGMTGFSSADVIYLIMTDRFADGDTSNDGPHAHNDAASPAAVAERAKPRGWHGGDLRGIAQHIDYLQALGITTVWTTPVYQNHSPDSYHGYHATDYYAVDEHFGTIADLQSLVAQLHTHGMKLLLDTVPNHVGPRHPWVNDSPTPDWFHGTAAHHTAGDSNFEALVNPDAPERDRLPTLHGWFVDELPDMNTENSAVAQYLRQNAVWWIEQTGADGLRLDTFPYVDRAFWHDFHAELAALYPHLTDVGEISGSNPQITAAFAAGSTGAGVDTGLYTPFDFPFYHAASDVFGHGAPFSRVVDVIASDGLYPHPERLVPFLDNHDKPRFAEVVTDPRLQKVAMALLLTTRGTPQLYQGDELAQSGGEDPDNRRDFPGGFPADKVNAFESSNRTPAQQSAFTFVQQMLSIRRTHPALQFGAEQILQVGTDTLVYVRVLPGVAHSQAMIIALNKSSSPRTLAIQLDQTALAGVTHLQSVYGEAHAATLQAHTLTLTLEPKSAAIASAE